MKRFEPIDWNNLPDHAETFFRDYFSKHPEKGCLPEMNELRKKFQRKSKRPHCEGAI